MGKYFGTDGFRGIVNDKLRSREAYRIGRFIGQYPKGKKNKILIARDTRISGPLLESALISGLCTSGADVTVLGVSPTPSISYIIKKFGFDFGIMISASHNPYYDNGIKLFGSDGIKLDETIEQEIEQYIDSIFDTLPFKINDEIVRVIIDKSFKKAYTDFLISLAENNINKYKLLVDCSNGASYKIVKEVYKSLKIDATFISDKPNGININEKCGSTHLDNLISLMKNSSYDLGIAFDGDADRIMCVNAHGDIIDGDGIIYLLAKHLKSQNKLNGNTVVLTIMSNLGTKNALEANGIKYLETDVGDRNVQKVLLENNLSIGGEQSGHIINFNELPTGDAILTSIKVLNALCNTNSSLDEAFAGWKALPQLNKNVVVINKEAVISNAGLKKLINVEEKKINKCGRILVRPSGTEPFVRVMCESPSLEKCNEVCDTIINYINSLGF